MGPIKYYLSEEGDPWYNLALENLIFRTMDPSVPIFLLWRNRPSVILGRYQNPWIECNLKAMNEDHILLARRQSGGGTVYHDWGNTNFTFFAGNDFFDIQIAFEIILEGIKTFGIEGNISERNDLIINNGQSIKKFSGSAFRKLNDRSFHHGTLLMNTDLAKLNRYLDPETKKLHAKGVKSVKSRVINLSEINPHITHESFSEALTTRLGAPCIWKKESVLKEPLFQEEYKQLTSIPWIYGKTPPFIHSLEGIIDGQAVKARLHIKEGVIEKFDSEHPIFKDYEAGIHKILFHSPYSRASVEQLLTGPELKNLTRKALPKEISQFIIEKIE